MKANTLAAAIGSLCLFAFSTRAGLVQTNEFSLPDGAMLQTVVFGNGVFAGKGIVRSTGQPLIFTSTTGQTWTTNAAPADFQSIAFDGGLFWANSRNALWNSTNGLSWTGGPSVPDSALTVLHVSGSRMMLIDCMQTHISTNSGSTWQSVSNNSNCGVVSGAINGSLFLSAFETQSGYKFAVSEGTSWQQTSYTPPPYFRQAVAGNGLFTAFYGESGNELLPVQIRTSENGRDWTPFLATQVKTVSDDIQVWQVGGRYLMAASIVRKDLTDTNLTVIRRQLFVSTDLENWTSTYELPPDSAMWSPAFGAGSLLFPVSLFTGGSFVVRIGPFDVVSPIIDRQPRTAEVYPGDCAKLSVVAFGTGPLRYQWFKNNVPLDHGTNSVLEICAATAADAGDYDVTITNDAGSARSQSVALNIAWLRVRNYAGLDLDVAAGSTVQIEGSESPAGPWNALTNFVVPSRPYTWIDYDSPGRTRFYRAAKP